MSTLIQNGVLLCPDGPVNADLRVVGEKIAEIGANLPAGDSRVLDASGKLVFPGFIDTHTHFEMNKGLPNETADGWASGTLAALAGAPPPCWTSPSRSGGPLFPPPWRPGTAGRMEPPPATTAST